MKRPKECPCFSGQSYSTCCAPFHEGVREAATPEQLMRSRYAGFALGLGPYLLRTLAKTHEDRTMDETTLVRELSTAKDRQKFMGLSIMHASESGDVGEVLFAARIFTRGTNMSFAELSTFQKESGEWKYASGILVPHAQLPDDPTKLSRKAFLAIAGNPFA